jgi:putative membrane protein
MIRLVAVAVVSVIANAIGLVVAAVVLDDMTLDVAGAVTAILVFTGVAVLVEPLIRQTALKNAPALLGSTALVATLISLVVAALVTDGLSISGTTTWVLATVIVWVVALAARLLLPFVIFRAALSNHRD